MEDQEVKKLTVNGGFRKQGKMEDQEVKEIDCFMSNFIYVLCIL